jgi:hypothetical protein
MKRRELPLPIETELLPALAAVWHRPAHKLTGEALTPGSMRGAALLAAMLSSRRNTATQIKLMTPRNRIVSDPHRRAKAGSALDWSGPPAYTVCAECRHGT